MSQLAIYPGSFDPVTYGHIDLIKRATRIFDEVVVAVVNNAANETLFNADERVAMLQETTQDIKNIHIEVFQGLIIDFAKKKKSNMLIRGLRMISDFEYEFQMALTNRRLDEHIETVFLMPSERYSFLSSTLIKEAASLGADVSSFVPEIVAKRIQEKLQVI